MYEFEFLPLTYLQNIIFKITGLLYITLVEITLIRHDFFETSFPLLHRKKYFFLSNLSIFLQQCKQQSHSNHRPCMPIARLKSPVLYFKIKLMHFPPNINAAYTVKPHFIRMLLVPRNGPKNRGFSCHTAYCHGTLEQNIFLFEVAFKFLFPRGFTNFLKKNRNATLEKNLPQCGLQTRNFALKYQNESNCSRHARPFLMFC